LQTLLGYDADSDPSVIGAFEESDDERRPLPRWATDWGQTNSFKYWNMQNYIYIYIYVCMYI
jgi:hypothetical protein